MPDTAPDRQLFIRQQTTVINATRAHLAEFGIVARVGCGGMDELLDVIADPDDERVPEIASESLAALGDKLQRQRLQILEFDQRINAWHRSNEMSRWAVNGEQLDQAMRNIVGVQLARRDDGEILARKLINDRQYTERPVVLRLVLNEIIAPDVAGARALDLRHVFHPRTKRTLRQTGRDSDAGRGASDRVSTERRAT